MRLLALQSYVFSLGNWHWPHLSHGGFANGALSHFLRVITGPDHSEENDKCKLFCQENMWQWIVFTLVFVGLVLFDNVVLHRSGKKLTFNTAVLYVCFWLAVAGSFCVYVYHSDVLMDSVNWGTAYLLEWMLSVDNLFVFHRIFDVFHTPDEQKHKPLFWGIFGAIFFRMILFVVGQALMHNVHWMHYVFGAFLIYTGIKALSTEDDDDEGGPLFDAISRHLCYVDIYHPTEARFFMKVPIDTTTGKELLDRIKPETPGSARSTLSTEPPSTLSKQEQGIPSQDSEANVVYKWRGTRLLLVVLCLEVTDVMFAFDSVSVIIAQIPDLYLSYTACIFAMLGLRATFFLIDELVKLFSLLAYGVAAILIFIGLKLMFKQWIHIEPWIVCIILFTTLTLSIVGSLIMESMKDQDVILNPEEEIEHISVKNSRLRGLPTTVGPAYRFPHCSTSRAWPEHAHTLPADRKKHTI